MPSSPPPRPLSVLFLAPADVDHPQPATGRPSRTAHPGDAVRDGALPMLKAAREAAAGMRLSDAELRAVLDDPDEVTADASRAGRTRLRRGRIEIVTGSDGMVLRVGRTR